MEAAEKTEELAAGPDSRRAAPRYGVDGEASLLLVKHGSTIPCRIVDFSLNGCRMYTKERFPAGTMVSVEVSFLVRGLAFRFSGTTQWTDGRNLVGIRFVDVPMRRKEDLVEALSEVEAEIAAKAAKEAAEKRAAEEQAAAKRAAEEEAAKKRAAEKRAAEEQAAALAAAAALVVKQAEQIVKQAEQDAPRQSPVQAPAQIIAAQAAAPAHAKLTKRERRVQSREDIDTSAVIHLINVAARLPGRILDLSLGGCRIRTDECFPVGIYTRVETEFRLEGMPFRLGGVIQAIHDPERRNVGIRFVDMSERRREQIEQLIEEIQELRERGTEGTENREEGSDKTLP